MNRPEGIPPLPGDEFLGFPVFSAENAPPGGVATRFGVGPTVSAQLILEAFGSFTPKPEIPPLNPNPDPEYPEDPNDPLWSVFRGRSGLMGWAIDENISRPRLWYVYEGYLTFHRKPPSIAVFNVGLATDDHQRPPGTDPAIAIPPLVQCAHDCLAWCGKAEIAAIEATVWELEPRQPGNGLRWRDDGFSWFWDMESKQVPALLTLASSPPEEHLATNVAEAMPDSFEDIFKIGPLVQASEEYAAGRGMLRFKGDSSDSGIAVMMPEWSPASIGWVLSKVYDTVLELGSTPREVAVRLTRLPGDD